jgi:hypothetical protein
VHRTARPKGLTNLAALFAIVAFIGCKTSANTDNAQTGSNTAKARQEQRDSVLVALDGRYPSAEERNSAIIQAIAETGTAPPSLTAVGSSLYSSLQSAHVAGAGWGCGKTACYFHITSYNEETFVAIRDKTASGYPMVITPDGPPTKLMILLPK